MTTKKPNFIIKFDNSNPTQAEKEQAFLGLFNCLAKIAIRIESEKEGTIKEQKEIEQNLMKFHSETLLRVQKELKKR